MSTLTLRLAGPLQSWGSAARFVRRTTEAMPTKSGVIGLLAAAQGLTRDDNDGLARLARLRFGVRVDQPGMRVRDFQTAHHAVTGRSMPLTERFYLSDAVFVAALEGDHAQLTELEAALHTPVYPPYLGRRSCPPAGRLVLRVHADKDVEAALRAEPWQAATWHQRSRHDEPVVPLTLRREPRPGERGETDTLRDQPLSFAAEHRRHALRGVVTCRPAEVANPHHRPARRPAPGWADHDPMTALAEAAAEGRNT
ncbi:type I-E CRISPR-associated protein Cas5/CasD [Streptomyces durbertensis]|uniref:Type I-E CRISPR-associated protein Cas5/CasD n=1 Tax=Streptomyces durbertensis TaxID=2448886 RepID=A0ABR6ENE9_9ACTN|nr:type I-E CRISPR-associated protein Cas5/CasD [Streptomyces durbertensis]MBB1246871.1 type I-E CRISPR-associated protein Cas5/CasD [Streptomyces durbertensis]